jgi:hypothetical protein
MFLLSTSNGSIIEITYSFELEINSFREILPTFTVHKEYREWMDNTRMMIRRFADI